MTAASGPGAGRIVVDVAGVRIDVLTDPGSSRLASALAPMTVAATASANGSAGAVDVRGSGDDVESALGLVARAAIDLSSELLLHAGLVARGERAVMIPGPSGTGKSTLTAACLRRGFDYLTDEMVAVDLATARVTGWPRPLMLTARSLDAVGLPAGEPAGHGPTGEPAKAAVPASRLGARTVGGPASVTHVVLPRLGAPASGVRPVPAGQVLTAVLAASFNHYRFGAASWEAAVRVARGASAWQLDVADIDSAADLVADLASTPAGQGAAR